MTHARIAILVAAAALSAYAQSVPDIQQLETSFRTPPAGARIMMRWWWFGAVADTAELEREMIKMKEGGIGGFEVQPVYPLVLDQELPGITNKRFLSPEFLRALRFTAGKARELGLRMDVTLGSGWPYGGPSVPISQAAGRLRMDAVAVPAGGTEVALPRIADGEQFLAAFLAEGSGRTAAKNKANPLRAPRDGKVAVPANLQGPHSVLFFISSRTRQAVKRASNGAEGWVLDHYDRAALDNYLRTVGEPLLKPLANLSPYAIFCDSLEVFGSDWTPDLLAEFRKRRGYDLLPYLPVLAGGADDNAGAIRNDWVSTLTELTEERFLKPLRDFAHHHGARLRAQTYGTPPVNLSSEAIVDLPEGEEPHWKRFTSTRWASSANHLFDRPVTSSETWTWLHSPAFRATPLDMKVEADRHFLIGVNQLIGHGWPYSPAEAGEPGWRFYASAVFNHHNPWWIVMPEVSGYMQRVSYLLRQGKPANDIALYLPIADVRAGITLGRATIDRGMNARFGPNLIPQILESGYQYDLFDDGTSDRIGSRYPVVVLPDVSRIPVSAYRNLERYVERGGILIATKRTPSMSPGLIRAEEDSAEVRSISKRLFEDAGHKAHMVAGDGPELREALHRLRQPDVLFDGAAPEIGFLHRSTADAEVYFLANTGNTPYKGDAVFRLSGLQAESWNPFSGEVKPMPSYRLPEGRIRLTVNLAPYESTVIVFTRRTIGAQLQTIPTGTLMPPIDVSFNWRVTFPSGTQDYPALHSWTDNPATRFFSGTAVYERRVTVSQPFLMQHPRLDFGPGIPLPNTQGEGRPGMRAWIEAPVRDAAVVYINGRRAGAIWQPPYSLDAAPFLRPGENTIRIEAANTAINKLAEVAPPDYKKLKARYGDRFQPQDMNNLEPLPSGILGTVRLVPTAR